MSQPGVARRGIGAMAAASLLSAVCGVVLTFWIPRLLTVDQFGYWRTFLLYIGYAGFVHLGLVDGALLHWSQGAIPERDRLRSLGKMLRFVGVEHAVLLAGAGIVAGMHPGSRVAGLAAAVAAYALLFNLVGLIQVYLQSRMRFSLVAAAMTAPSVLFVLALCGLARGGQMRGGMLVVAYLGCWAVTLAVLTAAVWRRESADEGRGEEPGAWRLGAAAIATGWPIMLAKEGFGLMQSADRVTVNLTRPIHHFAIYSLSQSTVYVPIALLGALSRVAFSLLARVSGEARASGYRATSRLLALFWLLLLPYDFAVEWVVARFLPRYAAALPAGRVLLFSVLFLSAIQMAQMNGYSLEGKQRQFFAGAAFAVGVAFATAWLGSRIVGTLTAVAWSQVATALLWWLGNEWMLRDRGWISWKDRLRIPGAFALGAAGLEIAGALSGHLAGRCLLYYGFEAAPVLLLFQAERQAFWKALRGLPER